jgi:hypothetical protein
MATSKQIFDNRKAKALFVRIYNELSDQEFYRDVFSQAIREAAEEKIVSLDDLDTFYLTEDDVYQCHERVMQEKDRREGKTK